MSVRAGSRRFGFMILVLSLVAIFCFPASVLSQTPPVDPTPVFLWPGNVGYPQLPNSPIILLHTDGSAPSILWPGDPDYPSPGQPMVVLSGDPLYSLFPNTPLFFLPGSPAILFPLEIPPSSGPALLIRAIL